MSDINAAVRKSLGDALQGAIDIGRLIDKGEIEEALELWRKHRSAIFFALGVAHAAERQGELPDMSADIATSVARSMANLTKLAALDADSARLVERHIDMSLKVRGVQ